MKPTCFNKSECTYLKKTCSNFSQVFHHNYLEMESQKEYMISKHNFTLHLQRLIPKRLKLDQII